MRKKLLGSLLAAALVVTQAVSVFAAGGSKTADVTLTGDAAGYYEVSEGTKENFDAVEDEKTLNTILLVNDGTTTLEDFAKDIEETYPEVAKELEGKSMLTKFFDLIPINGGIKTEDGKYLVTLSVPQLTEACKNVKVLHYSTVRKVWEVITPTDVNYANKQITVEFEDLSPVAIIADVDASQTTDSTTAGTSPKTGVNSDWMLWMGAAVLFGLGAVVFKKSRV